MDWKVVPWDTLRSWALDSENGWSIGTFGAIGEFVREADEACQIDESEDTIVLVTSRGGLRIESKPQFGGVAWESMSADGESWGHTLALCVPEIAPSVSVIQDMGIDQSALRPQDRGDRLFNLGIGIGDVHMCVRTSDTLHIQLLEKATGKDYCEQPEVMADVLRAQPHRVMLSPAGRIEVYQPIPLPDGNSPDGPHTHLLLKLVRKGPHSANTPLPDGSQSVMTMHPRSPWRDNLGRRHAYIEAFDQKFHAVLKTYGLPEDVAVEKALDDAFATNIPPEQFAWPDERRGRAKARVVLRRKVLAGEPNALIWKQHYD